jgi:hypothetical protein
VNNKDAYEILSVQATLRQLLKSSLSDILVCSIWADTLAEFLGFVGMEDLMDWAKDNPKIWGNEHGFYMFSFRRAFTDKKNKKLTHIDIINHWKQVLKKVEA